MKIAGKAVRGFIGLGLGAGLFYGGLALNSKPVYASSCNCTEEKMDAQAYCLRHYGNGGIYSFSCPFDGSNYLFICAGDSLLQYVELPCD